MKSEGLLYDIIEGEWDPQSFHVDQKTYVTSFAFHYYCTKKDISIDYFYKMTKLQVASCGIGSKVSFMMQRMFYNIRLKFGTRKNRIEIEWHIYSLGNGHMSETYVFNMDSNNKIEWKT